MKDKKMTNELQKRLDSIQAINFLSDIAISNILCPLPDKLRGAVSAGIHTEKNNFINVDLKTFIAIFDYIKSTKSAKNIIFIFTFNFSITISQNNYYLKNLFTDSIAPRKFKDVESLYDFLKNYGEI